ncbi:MAG: xylulokinase [Pasteurella oralis]|uniref:xylulokinase n=1 Tax=Pasteurella oralis TaxID=1071947 RepID=UPI002706EC59|nr:xylulokinase [Pasteurella oralis]
MYAGIDCGTQSTKVILIDTVSKKIIGEGQAKHHLISEANGKREQEPQWWIDALISAFHKATQNAQINPKLISGIAVSGQQHGLVALDKHGDVLIPAKLWCDTETSLENEEILEKLGGKSASLSELGLVISTGYTASKILWLKKYHPEAWQKLDCILLPHDYLNFWLTGRKVMENGDASGTGLFDVRKCCWSERAINTIDTSDHLRQALPQLVKYDQIIGTVQSEVAEILGISPSTLVAAGGGDNMMGAIGTGNVQQGIITMSLGTSGTLFGFANQPISPASELIANFCASTHGWLPLICTMNITSATSLVQNLFEQDLTQFNQAIESAPIGAEGVTVLPFFNGERVPNLPNAKAIIAGLDATNFTPNNLIRAVLEGATFSLRYGLDLFSQANITPTQIRLIGGGAKSAVWRQIVADVMNCPIICLSYAEAAALGAAIQAAWVIGIQNKSLNEHEKQTQLVQLCDQFVTLDEQTLTIPKTENVKQYQTIYINYLSLLNKYYLEK